VPAENLPAISLVASPGKRATILELAAEADRRGFAGLACPSLGSAMSLSTSLAHVTERIPFWTAIQPIYLSVPVETAGIASHIQEVSGGRFALGLGVSHAPVHQRLGLTVGRPLEDARDYVAAVKAAARDGAPPIYLAAMRDRMLALAVEVAEGAIWANAALSAIPEQLARVGGAAADTFFRANMVPTVIDEDRQAADAVNRRTMTGYAALPNYRNYWRAAGYAGEMDAIEAALAAGERDRLADLMPDDWLHDVTIGGPAGEVRERLAAWAERGVLPIAVMSSTTGGQAKAIGELFAAYG
jgi:alkanesulfonate monooxygenase SsuD/methylene tetrahydromethanopterin reductase-like flavin-dependent oxidoreductase (luciferase family)